MDRAGQHRDGYWFAVDGEGQGRILLRPAYQRFLPFVARPLSGQFGVYAAARQRRAWQFVRLLQHRVPAAKPRPVATTTYPLQQYGGLAVGTMALLARGHP